MAWHGMAWHGLDVPHVWDIWGGFLSLTSILDISTALMRPRRPKQYCLQLYIYIYIYIYIFGVGISYIIHIYTNLFTRTFQVS